MTPTPRMLLLQARADGDPMAAHEHACFVKHTGLPSEAIICHDLRQGPPTNQELARFDALTVGGAGDFSVARGSLPRLDQTLDFLRDVVDKGFPTFASCFGYQCFVAALGSEIIHDPTNMEVGTYEITLTDAGASDSLFKVLPRKVMAQLGHQDRATGSPKGIPNLASSERSACQALRVPEKPIWATQFHPELDRVTNRERYEHYLEVYSGHENQEEREATMKRFRDSPETDVLLPRFLELVFDWSREDVSP